jgi:hypothetical protein
MLMVQNPLAGHMEVAAWFFRDHHGGFVAGATHFLKEICPRGNNNVVIIFLVHDNVYIPC